MFFLLDLPYNVVAFCANLALASSFLAQGADMNE